MQSHAIRLKVKPYHLQLLIPLDSLNKVSYMSLFHVLETLITFISSDVMIRLTLISGQTLTKTHLTSAREKTLSERKSVTSLISHLNSSLESVVRRLFPGSLTIWYSLTLKPETYFLTTSSSRSHTIIESSTVTVIKKSSQSSYLISSGKTESVAMSLVRPIPTLKLKCSDTLIWSNPSLKRRAERIHLIRRPTTSIKTQFPLSSHITDLALICTSSLHSSSMIRALRSVSIYLPSIKAVNSYHSSSQTRIQTRLFSRVTICARYLTSHSRKLLNSSAKRTIKLSNSLKRLSSVRRSSKSLTNTPTTQIS